MNLTDFAFLTDENIDPELHSWLQREGLSVYDVKMEGLFGVSDREILRIAWEQQAIILTQDSDFGTIVFQEEVSFVGIIYVRPGHHQAEIHLQTLKSLFNMNPEIEPPFLIIGEHKGDTIRFRIREVSYQLFLVLPKHHLPWNQAHPKFAEQAALGVVA